ncbi:MAG TPA: phosphoribosylglycinamide formyltransferase [Firmicutes bacterium]|nr:phosphoribosylglycinamide formyltransferase [Bacillota bacterium]
MPLKRIAVFVSGGGSNFQAILDQISAGRISGEVVLVISDKPSAYALTRAQNAGIETWAYEKRQYTKPELEQKICDILEKYKVDFCVLAGYLSILGASVIRKYPNKIINIHPSLIPSFCGMGFYGKHVHQGVLDYGAKVSGATVHFVDEGADTGPIILQESVKVMEDDDAQSLADRVLTVEHKLLPEAVRLMCEDAIQVNGRKVTIKKN